MFTDKRGGNKAMLSATRGTAGIAGAVGGMITSGPPGAVAGYVAGTNGSDAVISGKYYCTLARFVRSLVVGQRIYSTCRPESPRKYK